MKTFLFIALLFLLTSLTLGETDSLFKALKTSKEDEKAEIYNSLGEHYYYKYSLDSAKLFTDKAFELASKYNDNEQKAWSYFNYAEISVQQNKIEEAIEYKKKSAELYNKSGVIKYYALCLNDIGY